MWLKTLQTCILTAQTEANKANCGCGLNPKIAKEFESTFKRDEAALVESRDALQTALKGDSPEVLKGEVLKTEKIVTEFKWNQKAFSSATRVMRKRMHDHVE